MLLNGLLKDELGFQGFVVSDWYAQFSGVGSALAGLDMTMPGDGAVPLLGDSFWNFELSRSILNGTIPIERLNDMVLKNLTYFNSIGADWDR
jgi:beta-glucosidase